MERRSPGPRSPDAARWPRSVIDRPLTLPSGLVLAGPDVIGSQAPTGGSQVLEDLNLGVGITDEVELNTLTPSGTFKLTSLAGPWDGGIGVKLLRGAVGGRLEVIARAVAGYDFDAHAARAVRVGLQAQFNLTSKLAVVVHDTGVMRASASMHSARTPLHSAFRSASACNCTRCSGSKRIPTWSPRSRCTRPKTRRSPTSRRCSRRRSSTSITARSTCSVTRVRTNDCYHAGSTMFFGVGARYYAGRR